jgi:hypothetical protein
VTGDASVIHAPSGDSLAAVDLVGADLRPGEERTATLDLAGFSTSPYSVRAVAQALSVRAFLERAVAEHEVVRRAILVDPVGLDPATVALAGDVFAFRDSALIGLAREGLVTEEEAFEYVVGLPANLLPGVRVDGGEGPQELLAELASGDCVPASTVPECQPDIGSVGSALTACVVVFPAPLPVLAPVAGGLSAPMTLATTQGFGVTYSADAKVVTPCDPNILTGPAGYGDQRWVNAADALPYRVDFENLSGVASAPAQVVSVKLPLDPNLDPTTFRLLDIGFGSHVIPVPPDRTTYTVEPFYSDIGLRVRVTAGVDVPSPRPRRDPRSGLRPASSSTRTRRC